MRWVLPLLAALGTCAHAAPPVILISVDTLRADRLSCYGAKGRATSHIDAIAAGGTRFSEVGAQVPFTLPSHVSIFTSTYPFSSGVQDNGQAVPASAVTLSTMLKARGYRTGAFVGGFVLDRRFGLDRGFDVYDSPFVLPRDRFTEAADLKRLGEDVVNSATRWIEQNAGAPFFVFLHLFDLHTPDNLPPAVRARFPGPRYEAELAYVDEAVGHFWEFLKRRGLIEKALIVFLSDHGESLGEHGENTHGYFIYQSTIRVPLLIHWPAGSPPAPARVDTPVSLLGVAPTILQVAGIPAPSSFQGKNLSTLWTRKEGEEEIYGESIYAHRHFRTSSLRSLRVGAYKYIQAPKPELYDLSKDPGETRNLVSAQPELARAYLKRLNALRTHYAARKPELAPISPKVAESLRSLGYLAGPSMASASEDAGPDPKDRIADYADYRRAITLESLGQLSKSNDLLESVLARRPDQAEVRGLLALNQQRLGNHAAAVKNFRQVLQQNPINAAAHFSLAVSYSKLNQLDDAVQELRVVLRLTSQAGHAEDLVAIPAEEALGGLWIQKMEWEKARAQFAHLLTVAPENYEAHYNLAWLAGRSGHLNEAIEHLRKAIQADPQSATAHNALGSIYLQQKSWERAAAEFRTAVRLDPKLGFAHYNLGLVLGQQGDRQAAVQAFRNALKADPQLAAARDALSRMGL